MVVYANDSLFSVVLDVHAISLVNVHGTSRCLMALLGRKCCPPVREGFTEQWGSFQLQCVGSGASQPSSGPGAWNLCNPRVIYGVVLVYGSLLDVLASGATGPAVTLGRRTPVCIGPSERTVPTAAAAAAAAERAGYVCSGGTPHWVWRTDCSWPHGLVQDITLCLKYNNTINVYMCSV